MDTMTDEMRQMRQMLVDAAAALENLTDLDTYGDGSGEYSEEQARAVRLAGRLRDAAAGRKPTRSWDVFMETGVNVEVPADIDPDTNEGFAAIKSAAAAKFLDNVREGSFDIDIVGYCDE